MGPEIKDGIINPKTIFLFDIDGVLCDPQSKISNEMKNKINALSRVALIYIVTGNNYTKARDLLDGANVDGFFCNNADELRSAHGKRLWEDVVLEPLPTRLEDTLHFLFGTNVFHYGNRIEWRNPRMLNVSKVGRYAPQEVRNEHDASWREDFIKLINVIYPNVECSCGGSVSIDIYSKGADKSRAGMYINKFMNKNFVFIGDKTDPGGNDYPLTVYCFENPENISLTSRGTKHTIELIDELSRRIV